MTFKVGFLCWFRSTYQCQTFLLLLICHGKIPVNIIAVLFSKKTIKHIVLNSQKEDALYHGQLGKRQRTLQSTTHTVHRKNTKMCLTQKK